MQTVTNGYGKWLVLYEVEERTSDRRKQYYFKNVETGETKILPLRQLKKMRPLKRQLIKSPVKKHPLYRTWVGMKTRCYNPNHQGYRWYGEIGIKVCDRWLNSFWDFVEDVGERPEGTTLDRKDSYKDYQPDNVRWATSKEQSENKKPNSGWRKKRGRPTNT